MNRILVLFFGLFLLWGCTDETRIPSGIIGRDSMEHILWDILQAERYANTYMAGDSSVRDLKKETFKLYGEVFEIHHITKDEFLRSYKFYLAHPNISSVLLDSLAQMANRQRGSLYREAH